MMMITGYINRGADDHSGVISLLPPPPVNWDRSSDPSSQMTLISRGLVIKIHPHWMMVSSFQMMNLNTKGINNNFANSL